jgi:anti-anti-sigma factor
VNPTPVLPNGVAPFRILTCGEPGRFALVGELDVTEAGDCFDRLSAAAKGGCLRLDTSGLTFIDSTGIRALWMLAELADGITLERPRPNVRRVLEVVGLDSVGGIQIEDA